jgi:DNA repair exonuclease SbcCD ATPase subunit
MKRPNLIWIVPLTFMIGVAGFWLGRTRHPGSNSELVAQLTEENRALKSAIEKLRSSPNEQPQPADIRDTPKGGHAPPVPHGKESNHVDDSEALRGLRESLAATHRTIEELQSHATELSTQLDQAQQEQKRLAAIESDLTEQLAAAKRLAETKDTELDRKNNQLAQSEAANKKLRDDATASTSKSSQVLQASNELQELYRRRESYLHTLIGRYREITEQYRAFTSVLENRRGPEGTPGGSVSFAGPELARIQTSITMAEEDLRQLNTLNAQAQQIQKKLTTK